MSNDKTEAELSHNEPLESAEDAASQEISEDASIAAEVEHLSDTESNEPDAQVPLAKPVVPRSKTRKPVKPDSTAVKIFDSILMFSAVLCSTYVLVTSTGTYVAHPQYTISASTDGAGSGWNLVVDELNQVSLDEENIADVGALMKQLQQKGTPRTATIKSDKRALFGTCDWVASTLASRGVKVHIVRGD